VLASPSPIVLEMKLSQGNAGTRTMQQKEKNQELN